MSPSSISLSSRYGSPSYDSSSSAGAAIPNLIGLAPSSICAIKLNFSAIEISSLFFMASFNSKRSCPVDVIGPSPFKKL